MGKNVLKRSCRRLFIVLIVKHDLHKCYAPRFQPNWIRWIGYTLIVLYIFEFIQAVSNLPVCTFTTHLVPQKQKINKYSHTPDQKVLYSSKIHFYVSILSFICSSSLCVQRISMLIWVRQLYVYWSLLLSCKITPTPNSLGPLSLIGKREQWEGVIRGASP